MWPMSSSSLHRFNGTYTCYELKVNVEFANWNMSLPAEWMYLTTKWDENTINKARRERRPQRNWKKQRDNRKEMLQILVVQAKIILEEHTEATRHHCSLIVIKLWFNTNLYLNKQQLLEYYYQLRLTIPNNAEWWIDKTQTPVLSIFTGKLINLRQV